MSVGQRTCEPEEILLLVESRVKSGGGHSCLGHPPQGLLRDTQQEEAGSDTSELSGAPGVNVAVFSQT